MQNGRNPWETLARIVGPLMVWLGLAFLWLYLLLGNDWILGSLGETVQENSVWLIVRGIICVTIGAILIVWGYSGKVVAFVPERITPGTVKCPSCGAELLSSTTICPYCGRSFGR